MGGSKREEVLDVLERFLAEKDLDEFSGSGSGFGPKKAGKKGTKKVGAKKVGAKKVGAKKVGAKKEGAKKEQVLNVLERFLEEKDLDEFSGFESGSGSGFGPKKGPKKDGPKKGPKKDGPKTDDVTKSILARLLRLLN